MKLNISPHEAGSRGISFVPDLIQSGERMIMSDAEKEAWRGLTAEIITAIFSYIANDKYADAGDRKNGMLFVNHVCSVATKVTGETVTVEMVNKDGYPILGNNILDSVSESMLEVSTLEALLTKKIGQAEAQGVRGTVTISYSVMEGENVVRKKVRLIGNIPTFAVMKMREIYTQLNSTAVAPVASLGSLSAVAPSKNVKDHHFDVLGGRNINSLSDNELMSLWRYMNELMVLVATAVGKRLLNRQ